MNVRILTLTLGDCMSSIVGNSGLITGGLIMRTVKKSSRENGKKGANHHSNLANCSRDLISWSRTNVNNAAIRIKVIEERLRTIMELTRDPIYEEEEITLKLELNKLWLEEEIFWRQRSNVHWLQGGDQNSRPQEYCG
ncbi:unnamed protein product [Linum trigynum]|uniref:Uncharacterized protein n=1 Tax=Linum trigynum TaxID=586398 RepID=A0AAV2CPQ0_9ROSI